MIYHGIVDDGVCGEGPHICCGHDRFGAAFRHPDHIS
jgi:hypothetical protein